ncbi:hypothetical protein LMG31884_47320 (plasmid) [Xanthomonas hydrangeae]|uniref:hypothetical protein n=1 Tax=Xanthomonas hydrangeae TaxID=2775159 RepID=UPI0019642477|nr:hypothetical protein LMG31884_47320 [Xanthomonas hydrangeae]CAD7741135.1 hypothetical protein LMG31884_47320 [Xanthomonas hydrangeae]CAD7747956.1 hypothetical protein LMG31887_46490 [Xanthomonas hydrangeae]CAD7747957.1 hypothetical protein LMG31887_46490 [Xanthomonas hydrangeae]CAD7748166.1 hypothetical protein LMG31885_45000 [Xanthomonas hydrangeae]
MTFEYFDPKRQPARDKFGFTFHADLDLFTTDGFYDSNALLSAGFHFCQITLESDDPALLQRYYEDPLALTRWHPEPPSSGWRMVGLYDTDNNPVAIFIRPRQETDTP